jgi:hypothetical protein
VLSKITKFQAAKALSNQDFFSEIKAIYFACQFFIRSLIILFICLEWHNDPELLEASTSTLRALTARLAEEKSGVPLVQGVSTTDLDTLCRLAEQCKDVSVRINIYRVLASVSAICSENFTAKTSPLILVRILFH